VARHEISQRNRYAADMMQARYQMADAWRRSARLPRRRLPTVTIETLRVNLNRQIQQELTAAANGYLKLQDLLNEKLEQQGLTALETKLLRNCYFARADALYDLARYDDAIEAYSSATNRYQDEPESLEAYVQIANCHRLLDRPDLARGTLAQAKLVLQRIRSDADFTHTTRYDRTEWTGFLNWLNTL
jgi:tetratricopeptide (TPR) repeat protein